MTSEDAARSELASRIAETLKSHGSPLPDAGYPGDEYDCCAEELLDEYLVVPREVTAASTFHESLADVLARSRRGVTARTNETDRRQAETVAKWLGDYGRAFVPRKG